MTAAATTAITSTRTTTIATVTPTERASTVCASGGESASDGGGAGASTTALMIGVSSTVSCALCRMAVAFCEVARLEERTEAIWADATALGAAMRKVSRSDAISMVS